MIPFIRCLRSRLTRNVAGTVLYLYCEPYHRHAYRKLQPFFCGKLFQVVIQIGLLAAMDQLSVSAPPRPPPPLLTPNQCFLKRECGTEAGRRLFVYTRS